MTGGGGKVQVVQVRGELDLALAGSLAARGYAAIGGQARVLLLDVASYSRRALMMVSSVRCRMSSQSARSMIPSARSRRASARTSWARWISASSSARRGAC